MKKSKLFAPFLMLFAAAVASIVMFKGNYDTTDLLIILLCVMVFFYILGCLIERKICSFVEQIKEREKAEAEKEGEVIEKETTEKETTEKETTEKETAEKETVDQKSNR